MMNHSWKIFVISLRRVRERREQVLRQLLPLGLPFEIVDATDALEVKPEMLVVGEESLQMSNGAVACYQSHLGVLQRIVDYGLDYSLILEDDFVLGNAPTLTIANLWDRIPPGADHIQLHGMKGFMSGDYEIDEEGEWFNKLRCTNFFTVGYVISRSLAYYILEYHRIPRMPIDGLFVAISKMRTFDFYEVTEPVIEHDWNMPSNIHLPLRSGPLERASARASYRIPLIHPASDYPKVLCYTLALDLKEVKFYRQQARMMVASMKRCGFRGDIKIIHNGDTEIFDHPHPKVKEIRIDTPTTTGHCYQVKFKARDFFSVDDYDWVLFLDSDFIVSANLDAWFTGPEIIRYVTEPNFAIQLPQYNGFLSEDEMENLKRDGINSGAFVIKADHFQEVLALWEQIDAGESPRCKIGDQHAWNRLLLDTDLPTKLLAKPEVKYFYHHSHVTEMLKVQVLHYCGCDEGEKVLAMQAKFISHFHTDGDGTLIRLLER